MTSGEKPRPFNPELVIQALVEAEVQYVLVGGLAMAAQGVAYTTNDVDIVYERSSENIERLVAALRPFHPRLNVRGEPEGVPFLFDGKTIAAGGSFTLRTTVGDIDLLQRIDGLGDYSAVLTEAEREPLFGKEISILSLPALLRAKEATGRTKDLLVIPEIRAALEMRAQLAEKRSLDRAPEAQ